MSSKQARSFSISRDMALLLLICIMMSLGMNLTNSLWPLYIQSLGATVLQVSFVISITGIAGTLLRIPSGLFSDLYGRRKIIIISIFLAVFPPLLYPFSDHWEQLIPWGIIYSVAFAFYMTSRMAIIADYAPAENLIRIYSIMNLAWPLGSLIGPTVGGLLESLYGWNAIFYAATVLYIFCLVPGFLLPKPSKREFKDSMEETPSKGTKLDLKFFRPLFAFFLINLFTGLGMGTVNPITPIYLTEKFNVSTTEVGLFISVGFGLTAILTQIPAGILANRFGRKRFVTVCLALTPFLFILWTTITNIIILLLIQMAINGLWSMTWPASISMFMEHAPKTKRGFSSGFFQTGIMFGFTIGPTIGGYLWETLGKIFPYYASALFFGFCIPIMAFITEKKDA